MMMMGDKSFAVAGCHWRIITCAFDVCRRHIYLCEAAVHSDFLLLGIVHKLSYLLTFVNCFFICKSVKVVIFWKNGARKSSDHAK